MPTISVSDNNGGTCSLEVSGNENAPHHTEIINGVLTIVPDVVSFEASADFEDLSFANNLQNVNILGDTWYPIRFNQDASTLQPDQENQTNGWTLQDLDNDPNIVTLRNVPEGDYSLFFKWTTSGGLQTPQVTTSSADFNVIGFTSEDDTTGTLLSNSVSLSESFNSGERQTNSWDVSMLFRVPAGGLSGGVTIAMSNLISNNVFSANNANQGITKIMMIKVA